MFVTVWAFVEERWGAGPTQLLFAEDSLVCGQQYTRHLYPTFIVIETS